MKIHYNQSFDIIIIGAGFTGCALAYQFSKAKAKTLLLESSAPCSGTSAACAGRVQVIESETKSHTITAVLTPNNVFYGKTIILATGAWTAQIGNLLNIDIPIRFTKAEALVSEPISKVLNHHIGTTGFYKSVHGDEKSVTLGVGQHRNGSLIISNAITPTKEIDRASSAWGSPFISREFKKLFPNLASFNISRTWSAPSPFAKDFLPVVGWLPQFENIYLAAAFHLAIPTIPLFSEKISKHILDVENNVEAKFLEPFSPSRFF